MELLCFFIVFFFLFFFFFFFLFKHGRVVWVKDDFHRISFTWWRIGMALPICPTHRATSYSIPMLCRSRDMAESSCKTRPSIARHSLTYLLTNSSISSSLDAGDASASWFFGRRGPLSCCSATKRAQWNPLNSLSLFPRQMEDKRLLFYAGASPFSIGIDYPVEDFAINHGHGNGPIWTHNLHAEFRLLITWRRSIVSGNEARSE